LSVTNTIIVGEFAYGNPGSFGEPLGIWNGQALQTGDASGGQVLAVFKPQNPTDTPTLTDRRREYIYFLDGAGLSANTDPTAMQVEVDLHFARANVAITPPFRQATASLSVRAQTNAFVPSRDLISDAMRRWPIFWDSQELAGTQNSLANLGFLTNTLNTLYRTHVWGRYYDRQILSNRAFSRLISPAAISQFEGRS